MKQRILAVLVVLAAAGLDLWTLHSPAPRPADAPPKTFSAMRAFEIVEAIAREPHPLGSEENERVRGELVRRLEALGLETRLQAPLVVYDHPLQEETRVRAAWPVNVLARLEGRTDAPALALMSHYDSVPTAPGAGDAASGVATLLETARALVAADELLARDVILVLTDGEEVGLMGAQGFLWEHPWADDIGLLLNLEARGAAGPPFMFQTSPGNAGLISHFARAAPFPVASSMSMEVYRRMPNDTDATIVNAAGIPFLNFAFVDDFFRYHAGSDTPENLSLRSLQHEGDNALALVRHFGNLETIPAAERDATYFSLSPHFLVRYPAWATWVVGILALLAGLWALLGGWRNERFRLASLGTGALFGVAGWLGAYWGVQGLFALMGDPERPFSLFYRYHLLVVAFTLVTVGFLAGLWGRRVQPRRWTAACGALVALVAMALEPGIGLAALAAVGLLAVCAARPRWLSPHGVAAFHVLVWMALLATTLFLAPHASFLFAWPLLLGGTVLDVTWRRSPDSAVKAGLAFAPAALLWSTVLYAVYLALGISQPGMVMATLALVLGFGALWLYHAVSPKAAVCLAAVGIAILLFARLDDPYSPATPRPAEVFYALDTEENEAFWVSRDAVSIPWSMPLLGADPAEIPGDRFFAFVEETWRGAPAPTRELPGVEIEVLERDENAAGWRLSFRIRSAPYTERVQLALAPGAYSEGLLEDRPVPLPPDADSPWRWDLWGLPEDGATITISGSGQTPEEIHWTRIDYDAGDPVRQLIPPRPDDVMPRVWGLSESAVVAGRAVLVAGSR